MLPLCAVCCLKWVESFWLALLHCGGMGLRAVSVALVKMVLCHSWL